MKIGNGDNFCDVEKYKLYRTVYDILHPTISKKNISNYKVVFDEKLLPTLVFYPKRVSNMNSVIIMVPGWGMVSNSYGKYSDICKRIAKETDKLVVAIDYFGKDIKYPTTSNKVFRIINFLYDEFKKNGMREENIILMSDSTGCGILNRCLPRLHKKRKKLSKVIFAYPVCRMDYSDYEWDNTCLSINYNVDKKVNAYLKKYYSRSSEGEISLLNTKRFEDFPDVLVLTGDMDVFKKDGYMTSKKLKARYKNIKFASHGFLSCDDEEILCNAYSEICNFVND